MKDKTKDKITFAALITIGSLIWALFGYFALHDWSAEIPFAPAPYEDQEAVIMATITAYTASPDETDSTPDITASGKQAVGNLAANNCLEFGTLIEYGGEIYIIEDRMNRRYGCEHIDLLMADKETALDFGVRVKEVKVLTN